MNRVLSTLAVLFCMIVMAGCDENISADQEQAKQTEQAMQEANRQIGMPAILNFQERKLFKNIMELRDKENLICYAYIYSMNGKLNFIGKCIGFGLPASIQYSNPSKIVKTVRRGSVYHGPMPQPEPNGLFMPEGLSATWLMMIDADGKPRPVYIEPQIVVSPFPLHKE